MSPSWLTSTCVDRTQIRVLGLRVKGLKLRIEGVEDRYTGVYLLIEEKRSQRGKYFNPILV